MIAWAGVKFGDPTHCSDAHAITYTSVFPMFVFFSGVTGNHAGLVWDMKNVLE